MLSEWLRTAMQEADLSGAELARQLSEKLHRSIDRAAVSKMLKEERDIKADEMLAIEQLTGLAAPKTIQVPLKGRIGAGQEVYAFEDGGYEMVEANAAAKPWTIALVVDGTSMFPAYEPGTLIYYSDNLSPELLVNRQCVVKLTDGRIFVKILRRGRAKDTWTLQSVNPAFADMEDQLVEWVAKIDWTKPRY